MSDAALALAGVFCGCQVNVFLLELITVGSPNTLYALTFAQYVAVTLLALPLVCAFRRGAVGMSFALQLRPSRLLLSHKVILAISCWLMSVSNNLVFGLYVSVPLHATFRSSSLLLNMLAGYFFLGKRYTLPQVLCATTICGGLVALAVEKSRKQSTNAANSTRSLSAEEYFWWACGIAILTCTTALSTGLGIFQEHMYKVARRREERSRETPRTEKTDAMGRNTAHFEPPSVSPPPMWAEALFFSHAFSAPLFLLQPQRLAEEFMFISSNNYTHFVLNAVTQYVCVAGVYVLNDKTSAFTLILTLTLRKLGTFALSVVYFNHYRHFSVVEWIAMMLALLAGALYPMLPKSNSHPVMPVKNAEKKPA